MCLRWHILRSYRFVVEVDFKVLTCSKSRKYCLFSDEEAERKCKLHRCFYCGKLQTKLPRHLSRIQSNEKLVVEAMHFPKKSKERYKKLEEIRRKGEYIRNIEAIRNNTKFAQFGGASKTRMQNYYHANFALVFSMQEGLVNIGRPASFKVYIYLSMEYFLL